jgi:DNA-binding XRE family transcriptional regulator
MIVKKGRKPDKEKAVRLTLLDREFLWLQLVTLLTGRTLPNIPLYPRGMDGIETFHFEVGGMAPCRDYELYPRRIDRTEFEGLFQFLKADDPFSAMARTFCYQLAQKVKEYRDQNTEEMVIPRGWKKKAKAVHLRLRKKQKQERVAEDLDIDVQTIRRWEREFRVFYLDLRKRVRLNIKP